MNVMNRGTNKSMEANERELKKWDCQQKRKEEMNCGLEDEEEIKKKQKKLKKNKSLNTTSIENKLFFS